MQAAAGEFQDHGGNCAKGGSIHACAAGTLPKIYQQIEEWALTAHQAIGCRGVSRSGCRYDESDPLVRLEVSTQPGMTETA
jgi:D-alanine-D-alanine ligase